MSEITVNVNNGSGLDDKDVHIGFWGDKLNATINGAPMKSINGGGKWYSLDEIQSWSLGVTTSGRIFVVYGESFQPVSGGGMPSVVAPSSAAYNKRFDKVELTFDGSVYGVANLTSIDYWSVPMSLRSFQNGAAKETLSGVKSGSGIKEIHDALAALSDPVRSGVIGAEVIDAFDDAGNPLPDGIKQEIRNPASGVVVDSNGNFVRIIGPNSYPPFGDPATNQFPGSPFTPYNTFRAYLGWLRDTFGPGATAPPGFKSLGDGKIARIKGSYGGVTGCTTPDCQAQDFDLWAILDKHLNLTLKGSATKVGDISMSIAKWNLLDPASVYGGNPMFSLNGGPPQAPANDVYSWILGEFYSGLNVGAIGSSAVVDGEVVGEMDATWWFDHLPQSGVLFDKLWTDNDGAEAFWNVWAAALNPRSDAYNFAYSERFSAPQLSLDPARVDTLEIDLLTADVNSGA